MPVQKFPLQRPVVLNEVPEIRYSESDGLFTFEYSGLKYSMPRETAAGFALMFNTKLRAVAEIYG